MSELLLEQRVEWHGVILNSPDWGDQSHTLAGTVHLLGGHLKLHLILNAYWEALEFQLPRLGDSQDLWRRCVDTYLDAPDDICGWADAPLVAGQTYRVSRVQWCCCSAMPRELLAAGPHPAEAGCVAGNHQVFVGFYDVSGDPMPKMHPGWPRLRTSPGSVVGRTK